MDALPPLIAHLRADISGFAAKMGEASAIAKAETSASSTAFNGLASVGKVAFLGIVGGAVAAGAASIKMAGDYEQATVRLITSAGESRTNIDLVRQGMLKMAGEVGYSAMELARAMYIVESSGQHGADGLLVLRAAAEGAKTENADLTVVANAVTSVLQDYHLKASDAALVTSKLVAAVSQGKTTFQELTGSLHSVLPTASAAHISLSDITAAVASMTVHGQSANQATENLAHTIQHLQTVTAPQAKELAALGISARQLSNDLGTRGLTGTLQDISNAIMTHMGPNAQVVLNLQDALKKLPPEVQKLGVEAASGSISMGAYTKAAKGLSVEAAGQAAGFATLLKSTHGVGQDQKTGAEIMQSYAAALKAATGDSTTLNTALMLTGENAGYTNNAVFQVAAAATEAGNHVQGWSEIQSTFNQRLDRMKDATGALSIELGTKLIPVVSGALDGMANFTKNLQNGYPPAVALAGVVGGFLAVAIAAYIIQTAIAIVQTTLHTASITRKTVVMIAERTATVAATVATAAWNVVMAAAHLVQDLNTFALQRGYAGTVVYIGGLVAAKVAQLATTVATAAATIAQGAWSAAQAVGVLIMQRGVFGAIAYIAVQGAIRVATFAWTAAQWLLNVALTANPIGIVIVVIAALVGAVIWAYQNVGWFRAGVNAVWGALQAFAGWIWGGILPALHAIAAAASAVGSALQSVNPFATHSPSLVEQVGTGTAIIAERYGTMATAIAGHARLARAALDGLSGPSGSSGFGGGGGSSASGDGGGSAYGYAGAGQAPASSTQTINVYAQTNADPHAIGREIGWILKTQ